MLEFSCKHEYPGGFSLDLSFTASEPVVALFGPSGSGKTSILEMIAGLREPDSGSIRLEGETVLDTSRGIRTSIQRRRIGMVFQDHLLFPHRTVRENLNYGRLWRPSPSAIADFERAVSVLELEPLLPRYPDSISGGERQRVALGRALLSRPRMLLMDEPLAAIDDALKIRILDYLERIVRVWDLPALFVSHSQAEVRRFARMVVVIENGRVLSKGSPDDALAAPGALGLKNAAGPVNLLRLEDVRLADGRWTGSVSGQTIHLPCAPPSDLGEPYIQFLPETVLLSPTDVLKISARNHLRGTVLHVVVQGPVVFVAIDVGQIIWSEITPGAVQELGVSPGAPMTCLIKSHSLHWVG